jgi:hypothetical protein
MRKLVTTHRISGVESQTPYQASIHQPVTPGS